MDEKLANRIVAFYQKRLPTLLGNHAVNFFKDNFDRQGFLNLVLEPWQPRKAVQQFRRRGVLNKKGNASRLVPTRAWTRNAGRGILIGLAGGAMLKRSTRLESAAPTKVVIANNLPYAAIHNYGLNGLAFGKHPFKMPKRQFIGPSETMNKELESITMKELTKIITNK